jgi:hypothetical protein
MAASVQPRTSVAPALSTYPHRLIGTAAVACAMALAACGSSHKPTGGAGSGDPVAFSHCMRSHGVPGFPDPGPTGAINIPSGAGVDVSSPAFQKAQSSCGKLLPAGGPAAPRPASAQAREQMLATSRCMRAHGVTGFPDPAVNPPAGLGNYSMVIRRGGVFIAVPRTVDTQSPAYRSAAAACRFVSPHGRGTAL